MKIIDIHSHMLYGVDDGSENLQMSLELIRMDYEQGVRGIFFTNHGEGVVSRIAEYNERFESISLMVGKQYPDLKLYRGCEVISRRSDMDFVIRNLESGHLPTLNRTKYVLTEFVPKQTKGMQEVDYCIDALIEGGYIPVIAHIERYSDIYDDPISNIEKLKEKGCFTQVNLYSVEQDRGRVSGGARKILANEFLKHQLVDFVGTDTHRLDYKSPEAKIGAEKIVEKYGEDYAKRVLFENAERFLIGKDV